MIIVALSCSVCLFIALLLLEYCSIHTLSNGIVMYRAPTKANKFGYIDISKHQHHHSSFSIITIIILIHTYIFHTQISYRLVCYRNFCKTQSHHNNHSRVSLELFASVFIQYKLKLCRHVLCLMEIARTLKVAINPQ